MVQKVLFYKQSFYSIIFLYVFLIGGSLQYFLGVSNTISTYLLGFFVIFFHSLIQISLLKIQKPSPVLSFGALIMIYILVNGLIINNSGLVKTSVYLFFAFLPIAAMYIVDYFINNPWRKNILLNFLSLILLVQIPILVIQKFTYEMFSNLRLSDKLLNKIDFSFGTFFMADDHALGFFLICFLLYAVKKYTGFKFFGILMLICFSILLTNSKTTYVLLVLTMLYLLVMKFKYGKQLILFTIPIIIVSSYYIISNLDLYQLLGLYQADDIYDTGYASRQQIIFTLYNQGLSLYGNGPYSYFNIITGSFTGGANFSQWIWNYYDLGLFGAMLFIIYTFIFYYQYGRKKKYALMITLFLLFYGFFTNYTTDFSMLLTYIVFIRL